MVLLGRTPYDECYLQSISLYKVGPSKLNDQETVCYWDSFGYFR